jgi:hypothetical protein
VLLRGLLSVSNTIIESFFCQSRKKPEIRDRKMTNQFKPLLNDWILKHFSHPIKIYVPVPLTHEKRAAKRQKLKAQRIDKLLTPREGEAEGARRDEIMIKLKQKEKTLSMAKFVRRAAYFK